MYLCTFGWRGRTLSAVLNLCTALPCPAPSCWMLYKLIMGGSQVTAIKAKEYALLC